MLDDNLELMKFIFLAILSIGTTTLAFYAKKRKR